MTCPQCSSFDIRYSRNESWKDSLQSLVGRKAFRCRMCQHRFFALQLTQLGAFDPARSGRKFQPDMLSTHMKKRRRFRRVIAFAVFAFMFSLFAFFLHYIAVDHVPKNDAVDMNSPNQ
jgi:hypothetical protein